MKDFYTKYKKGFLTVIIVFAVLLIFSVVRLVFAVNSAKTAVGAQKSEFVDENPLQKGWNEPHIRQMRKEIYWLEQQLLLAKSDSINLGINLADSIVQVQLKGTVLFQSKILKQHPAGFFDSMEAGAYLNFGKVSSIKSEKASIVKKPIKRVAAPGSEAEKSGVKQDTIIDSRLQWQFYSSNNVNVIISGVEMNADSTLNVNTGSDMLKLRAHQFYSGVFPKNYIPTLFIWLNDKDAKAIYRAHPANGKIIFRN